MPQRLIQEQVQKQQQVQRLTQQQMLLVKLLEMPLTELEENVTAEIDDNPALESVGEDNEDAIPHEEDIQKDEDFEQQTEREEREDALDSALERIGSDDRMPEYDTTRNQKNNADYEEIIYGDTTSFIDKLNEQVGERELSEKQHDIIEYLIGSLDDDGLLRKDIDQISDELAIYHNIDATEDDILNTLKILQDFDPAGIGARTLQECLLLQTERRLHEIEEMQGKEAVALYQVWEMIHTIMDNHFQEFKLKHWNKIAQEMKLSDLQVEVLQKEIRKLNPKPGSSMGETMGRNTQQITPDFIVDTADDGSISFSLNYGHLPELHVSKSFTDMIDTYRNNKEGMNRQAKEALLYAKEKVDKAQGFIDAIKQRRHTMYVTMKAIIEWQHKFFQDGDEADMKPMILKDIAEKTGLDISTISRVSNIKYAQTKWGTFPLRFFFSDGYTTKDGEELSTRKIKLALKEIVDAEDKHRPYSDDALAKLMKDKGFPVARRTIAKYREQQGIPVARMRKE